MIVNSETSPVDGDFLEVVEIDDFERGDVEAGARTHQRDTGAYGATIKMLDRSPRWSFGDPGWRGRKRSAQA